MIHFMPRVCADFYDKNRNILFRITRDDLGKYVEAPDSIQEDPLYRMLLDDGSIKLAPENTRDKRDLENNPYAGTTPDGKEIKPEAEKPKTETKSKADTKPRTTVKASVKTEAKAEDNPADSKPAETK